MTKEIIILGKGKYSVAENQQFVDRSGQLVRPVRGVGLVPVGEAYAFFYCGASKKEIEKALPRIRELTQTPSELELTLFEGDEIVERTKRDSKLDYMADRARADGTNILMKGNYPNQTNVKTADELASILNQAYQTPLYQSGEEFSGGIVYKDKNEYVFRE